MNKYVIIAVLGVIVLSGGAYYAFTPSGSTTVTMEKEVAPAVTPLATTSEAKPTPTTPPVTETPTPVVAPIPSTVNADTLTADIVAGASVDEAALSSESSEGVAVTGDLTNYTDVKTASYDTSL